MFVLELLCLTAVGTSFAVIWSVLGYLYLFSFSVPISATEALAAKPCVFQSA